MIRIACTFFSIVENGNGDAFIDISEIKHGQILFEYGSSV